MVRMNSEVRILKKCSQLGMIDFSRVNIGQILELMGLYVYGLTNANVLIKRKV